MKTADANEPLGRRIFLIPGFIFLLTCIILVVNMVFGIFPIDWSFDYLMGLRAEIIGIAGSGIIAMICLGAGAPAL